MNQTLMKTWLIRVFRKVSGLTFTPTYFTLSIANAAKLSTRRGMGRLAILRGFCSVDVFVVYYFLLILFCLLLHSAVRKWGVDVWIP